MVEQPVFRYCAVVYCTEEAAPGSPACARHSKPAAWPLWWHWWARTITLGRFAPIAGLPIPQNDFSCALHESAHAIAGIVLRVPTLGAVLPSVGIPNNSGTAGLALFGKGEIDYMVPFEQLSTEQKEGERTMTVRTIPTNVTAYLPVLLAGVLAEQKAGFTSDYFTAGRDDYMRASELAAEVLKVPFYTKKARTMLERAEVQAGTIVDQQWPWIIRTARRLELARRLTAAQITSLRTEPQRKVA